MIQGNNQWTENISIHKDVWLGCPQNFVLKSFKQFSKMDEVHYPMSLLVKTKVDRPGIEIFKAWHNKRSKNDFKIYV